MVENGVLEKGVVAMVTNSVVRLNQPHAASHNICGLCVPIRRCPVVSLSLRLNRESELQDVSCMLTMESRLRWPVLIPLALSASVTASTCACRRWYFTYGGDGDIYVYIYLNT